MKNRLLARSLTAIAATLLSAHITHAAIVTWNATNANWSLGSSWDILTAPGSADDVRFLNPGAGAGSTMDATRAINSLNYGQDTGGTHTTTINPGQTLTVSRAAAGDVLYVGSTSGSILATTLVPVTMTGSGGTLTLSGTGDFVVRQGFSANGSHMATLDLSGLDTLNATVGRLLVGQANPGAPVNRPSGTLILARTNFITLNGALPQVMIQDGGQNANGSIASVLTFGQDSHLYADVMRLGGQKGNANLNFNNSFASPSVQFRNADGVSRCTTIDFGYNGAVSSGNNTTVVADFSLGKIDLMANLVNIAQGNPGPSLGTCTSTLTIGAGVFDVNNLEIGWGNATGAGGTATATFNVDNNFLFSTGALLVVNSQLRLARTNGGAGTITGTLNLDGGVVIANSIVSGGGVSGINVNFGSTLVVSNTAGSLSAPIRGFTMSDGTLVIPALNSGAVVAVSNLTASGSQNTIRISSIPPISSYPVTFPLITYQSGAGGNFVLAPLPPASPSYVGTLVDTGNGVVSLQLTGGPVVDLALRWTGATDGTWDSGAMNWLYQGNPSSFFTGAAALFDDSSAQTNINLTEALSPGSVTVSNNTRSYLFTGIGNIAGASALVKKGSGSLTIDNAGSDNFGSVQILAGTLQLGTGGTDGSVSALNITNNGSLIVNRSGSLTLSSAISGSGGITKNGNGTLVLSGANGYNGSTLLNAGTLQLDQSTAGTGPLTAASGTVLCGSGVVNGLTTVAGQINPGPLSGAGTFKAHGGLTLSSGSTLSFDLSAADYSNPAVNDAIEIIGNLTANNNLITINLNGTPQINADYLIMTYSGSLSGSFNPVVNGTHFTAAIDTSILGEVHLKITGGSGANLAWNSASDSVWDSIATNWLNLSGSTPSVFYSGDTALFNDASVVTAINIASGVNVYPSLITDSSTNNSFTISGSGKISGDASIVKTGLSTLTIGTANNFTGPVDIGAGVLQTDNDSALGTGAQGTSVHDGGTLDLNGRNLSSEVITIAGSGANGIGALVNNGANQFQAMRQLVLAGDATVGGTGTWQINNGGGGASLSTGGNPFKLTKVGPNQVGFAQLSSVDAALADIEIQSGILEFSGLTPNMGDATRTNLVQAGGTLSFANGTVAWDKHFVLNGDGSTTTLNVGTGGNPTIIGAIELHGTCVFNVGGTALTIGSAITGDGDLTKNGASPLILTNVNTYPGETHINTGALRLGGAGSIASSSIITINAGATLTATGRIDGTLTLPAGQTLKGNGAVNGFIVANSGSTIAPGIDAIGALSVSNAITLSGTNEMELDEANGTNDVLRCNTTITYGGTLNLVNLGGPLTTGSTFKLFNASSYLGSFSKINPQTPGPGQTWDLSSLNTLGTIKVASGQPIRFGSITASGGNVVISGSNGTPSGTYYVIATTNLELRFTNWTRIATNTFSPSGTFSFTNAIVPSIPIRFFQIQTP